MVLAPLTSVIFLGSGIKDVGPGRAFNSISIGMHLEEIVSLCRAFGLFCCIWVHTQFSDCLIRFLAKYFPQRIDSVFRIEMQPYRHEISISLDCRTNAQGAIGP